MDVKSIFLCAKIFWKITFLRKGKLFFIILLGILTIKITFTVNFNNLERNARGEIGVKLLTRAFKGLPNVRASESCESCNSCEPGCEPCESPF